MGDTHTTSRASLDTAAASSLVVALLVIVAMGASVPVFAGTAAAAGTTDIDVSPATVETTTGETQTFTVTVPEASDGVSAYDFNVSVGDPAVAEITRIDDRIGLADTNVNTAIAADGSTANINAFGADEPAGSVEVIAVTVELADAGSTTLDVTVNALGDNTQAVNPYTIDEVTQPTIDVSDIEVGLDPTSQTATVGDERTYDIVAESVTDGLGYFDLTVSSTDTAVGPITAGEANAPINSTTIANDNGSAQFGGVYNASASTGSTVTLGTVTVGAEAAGSTDLTLDITEVGDSNGDEYTVIEGPDGDLTVEAADDGGDGGDDGGDGGDDGGDGDDDEDDAGTGGGGGGGGGGGTLGSEYLVSGLSPQTIEVTQGETITVSATVESDGIFQETKDVELRVDGETLSTQEVSLAGGDTLTVEFTDVGLGDIDAGEYEFGIYTPDSDVTGTITITAPDGADGDDGDADGTDGDDGDTDGTDGDDATTDGDDGGEGTDDSTPGFGVLATLVAVLVSLGYLTRRT